MKQPVKGRIGRPPSPNPKNVRLSIALDLATYEAVQAAADKRGLPASELIRLAIQKEVATR